MDKEHKIKQSLIDVSSFGNYHQVRNLSYDVELFIDFQNEIFKGYVVIEFERFDQSINFVVLDTNNLNIHKCSIDDKEVNFIMHNDHPFKGSLGTPLEVDISLAKTEKFKLKIEYETTKNSSGLQWMKPNQTKTGNKPFVFTQCEPILARTCLPCQDSPSNKVHFNNVNLIVEEGILALYGGQAVSKEVIKFNDLSCTKFTYTQKVLIPTYLFAVAAGELFYQKVSDRCGIYAEKGILEKAVEEFSHMDDFIKVSEEYLDFPYVWGDYNVVFLPQAFPFGGMENPNITFLNQCLIVGDKSMAPTIAHEIAHSWTGNLVTNKDWNNFWMNEGFTVFLERKIIQLLYGKEEATLEASVGYCELLYAVNAQGVGHNYTCLHTCLNEEDPDDAFSTIPYEKGFNLLYYIEQLIGENQFRDVLRVYIKRYAHKSIEYQNFKDVLYEVLKSNGKDDLLNSVEWDKWVYTPGFLPISVDFKTELSEGGEKLFKEFINGEFNDTNLNLAQERYNNMVSNVKIVFLNLFLNNIEKLTDKDYVLLSKCTRLNEIGVCNNAEINYTWFQVALRKKDHISLPAAMDFLSKQGRMKYLRPVLIQFYRLDKEKCKKFFNENKYLWHAIPNRLVEGEFEKIDKESNN